jgi:hypothetical protein
MYNDVLSFDHRRHVANIVDAGRRGEMGQRVNATILERAIGEATARVKSCGFYRPEDDAMDRFAHIAVIRVLAISRTMANAQR